VLVLGVRVDRPGRLLVDYHTVGGGEGGGVMSAEGKIKRNATTKELSKNKLNTLSHSLGAIV